MRNNQRIYLAAGLGILAVLLVLSVIFYINAGEPGRETAPTVTQVPIRATPIPTKSELPTDTPSATPTNTPTATPTPSPTELPTHTPTPTPCVARIVAVGDDLLHQKVVDSGKLADGNYNYDHLFAVLSEEFTAADLAVINQECIFGGPSFGYTGYPLFNSSTTVGDAIVKAGFDVVLQANNHVLDMGKTGLLYTLNYWKQYPEVSLVGVHENVESYDSVCIREVNGIRFALLNYTYGVNKSDLTSDEYYMYNRMEKEKIKSDVAKAKELADFIIVFPHWGDEYVYAANSYQKTMTSLFAELNVDLVIGTHAHVVQPIEWVDRADGGKMLVYYSIGNYVSTMDYTDTMLGGMAKVEITKSQDGVCEITYCSVVPIVTHYERGWDYNICVYRLTDYTAELAAKHYILFDSRHRADDFNLDTLWQLTEDILGDWVEYENTWTTEQ